MTDIARAGTFPLGDRQVHRIGYGAMQLAGPGVFGPPRDHDAAIAVLRAVVAAGVDHIDTSDFYGPHVVNRLIREALAPYPATLTIVSKLGAKRGDDGSWNPAQTPDELKRGLEDNLKHLGVEAIDIVNMRLRGGADHRPNGESIAVQFETLAGLQRQGLIRHLGVSNVNAAQVREARGIAPVACVQNLYNIANRGDDALIDDLAEQGIPYVPFFPLGGFSPLQSSRLSTVAARIGVTPMQVALAWLLRRSPNILLIPGTSSLAHLEQNLAVADITLDDDAMADLDAIGNDVSA